MRAACCASRVRLPAIDLGGGVTGFLSDRIGVSWDVRHFRSVGGKTRGLSFGREQLSFWRANMALVISDTDRSSR